MFPILVSQVLFPRSENPDRGHPFSGDRTLGLIRSFSEELSCGEVADKATVSGEKIIVGQLLEGYPAEIAEDAIFDLAVEGVDGEKLNVHRAAVSIVVSNVSDQRADDGLDAQLLIQLSSQGCFGSFAGLDLSAGKLPLEGHGLLRAALADEHVRAAQHEGRNHETERSDTRWSGIIRLVAWWVCGSVSGVVCRIVRHDFSVASRRGRSGGKFHLVNTFWGDLRSHSSQDCGWRGLGHGRHEIAPAQFPASGKERGGWVDGKGMTGDP